MPRRRTLLSRAALGLLALLVAGGAAIAALEAATPSAEPLARENPRTTALLEERRAEARAAARPFAATISIVPIDRISPRLVEAVVISEDAAFFGHAGFDWHEIRNAAAEGWSKGRLGRGASTITQQLAKNLWLGGERSLWRKVREAVLAAKLERALPKRRILALYLGVAEWGQGTFGAQNAARRWFGVAARDLTTAQAVVLASMLPAPRRAALAPAPRWLARRARRLLDRMLALGRIGAEEHARASAELERILGAPPEGPDIDLEPEDLELDRDRDFSPEPGRKPEAGRGLGPGSEPEPGSEPDTDPETHVGRRPGPGGATSAPPGTPRAN